MSGSGVREGGLSPQAAAAQRGAAREQGCGTHLALRRRLLQQQLQLQLRGQRLLGLKHVCIAVSGQLVHALLQSAAVLLRAKQASVE